METALNAHETAQNLKFHGFLFDLGVSSHQLDTLRGFSFRRDEPLDMRMDQTSGLSVAELLQQSDENELERILREYGEENWARRIARALVERRTKGQPIATTAQLAEVVEQAIPRKAWPRDIHVATRTFQGLRIAVNDELGQLKGGSGNSHCAFADRRAYRRNQLPFAGRPHRKTDVCPGGRNRAVRAGFVARRVPEACP